MNVDRPLYIDLDGVVFDFDRAWVDRLNDDYPVDADRRWLRPEMPQRYDTLHILAGFPSPRLFWQWWDNSGGYRQIPVYPGVRRALMSMLDAGWIWTWHSARPANDHGTTLHELIETQLLSGMAFIEKPELIGDLSPSTFIDDNPHFLHMATTLGHRAVRIERPWNAPAVHPELRTLIDMPHYPSLLRWWEATKGGLV